MMTLEITDANINSVLSKKDELVVVDFWAPWCGPCKIIGPIINELASEYKEKATIAKVNVEEYRGIADQYGIRNIPTIIFFYNGEIIDRQIGAIQKSALKSNIDRLLLQGVSSNG